LYPCTDAIKRTIGLVSEADRTVQVEVIQVEVHRASDADYTTEFQLASDFAVAAVASVVETGFSTTDGLIAE
jgi:hypothetical protein